MGNSLMGSSGQDEAPPQGAPPQVSEGASAPDPMTQYAKLQTAFQTLDAVRKGMDKLSALADTVTPEDVVREASILVAKGLTPTAVATLLSEMPETPEQLAQWVSQQDAQVTQREQQLAAVTRQMRQRLGTTALRGLAAHHVRQMIGAPDA